MTASCVGAASTVMPVSYQHRRTADEVWRCKKALRPLWKEGDWECRGYAKTSVLASLASPENDDVRGIPVPRLRRSEITVEEFYYQYAVPRRPCIIEGALDSWPAMMRWDPEQLLDRFRHALVPVGQAAKSGQRVRLKYKYLVDYMKNQRDDSPMHILEAKAEMDDLLHMLLDDYVVPDLFPHDFLSFMNPYRRPMHRMWEVGPKRSGSRTGADPVGSAMWTAVTHGRKRWVFFEPGTPESVVRGKGTCDAAMQYQDALAYFDSLLPYIKSDHPQLRVHETVQGPGDLLFVPGEWWHGSLNLEDTVAISQVYCGLDNFDIVWTAMARLYKKHAQHWWRNLVKFAPQLQKRAAQLNQLNGISLFEEKEGPAMADSAEIDSSSDEEADLDFSRLPRSSSALVPPWVGGINIVARTGWNALVSAGYSGAARAGFQGRDAISAHSAKCSNDSLQGGWLGYTAARVPTTASRCPATTLHSSAGAPDPAR